MNTYLIGIGAIITVMYFKEDIRDFISPLKENKKKDGFVCGRQLHEKGWYNNYCSKSQQYWQPF
jgi:hypothetical protein